MKPQSNFSLNWGGNVNANPRIILPKNIKQLLSIISKKKFITAGNQRSFGDNCINTNLVISMKNFNKIINFDKKKGTIEAESGLMLKNLLDLILIDGWFIPVTPGSKYVTLGGMIANNVHGKNIVKNQIKYYVQEFKLLTSNKKIIICSKNKNKKIFEMTIGGFGLTGLIISAKIKLKKIKSIYMIQKIKEFKNYTEFFNLLKKINKYEYNVSWVDNFNSSQIKGLCYFAKHNNKLNFKKNKKYTIYNLKLSFLLTNIY